MEGRGCFPPAQQRPCGETHDTPGPSFHIHLDPQSTHPKNGYYTSTIKCLARVPDTFSEGGTGVGASVGSSHTVPEAPGALGPVLNGVMFSPGGQHDLGGGGLPGAQGCG